LWYEGKKEDFLAPVLMLLPAFRAFRAGCMLESGMGIKAALQCTVMAVCTHKLALVEGCAYMPPV
jgi:hypothetical protein